MGGRRKSLVGEICPLSWLFKFLKNGTREGTRSLWLLNICKQRSWCFSADSWSYPGCRGQMCTCGFPPWLLSPGFHSFYSEMLLKFFQQGLWWTPRSQQGLQKEVKAGEGGQEEGDQAKVHSTQSFITHMWPDRRWAGSRKI